MQLVEQRVIKKGHPAYNQIDTMSFAAKNLWNAAQYCVRQSFIYGNGVTSYNQMDKLMQPTEQYKALPAKVAQQVLMLLDKSWKSYFAALTKYKVNPGKFMGRPKLPGYKEKDGRCVLVFTQQATSKTVFKKSGQVKLSEIDYNFDTEVKQSQYCQSRIVPKIDHYVLEIVYEVTSNELSNSQERVAAIDLGINNLMPVTSSVPGFQPVLVNGRPLKSVNQFFNKRRVELQSVSGLRTSSRIKKLTSARNHKVKSYLHRASRLVIDMLVEQRITQLVVGKNPDWKQNVNIGSANNQQFVQIPHSQLLDMLTYKGAMLGIAVIVREESYTSQASFLDGDFIPTYGNKPDNWKASGRRIKRGLYRTSNRQLINADVNASYNTLIKEFPNAFRLGDREVLVHPRKVNLKGHILSSVVPF